MSATIKTVNTPYGKVRILTGFGNYDRLFVLYRKSAKGYCVSITEHVTLDSMIEINGEYWFSTLKELKHSIS